MRLAHWVALDAVTVLLLGALVGAGGTDRALAFGLPRGASVTVTAATVLALVLRRLAPVPVFAATLALSAAATVIGATRLGYLAVAFAIYPVATAGSRRRAVAALAATLLAVAGTLLVAPNPGPRQAVLSTIITSTLVVLAAWTVGVAAREQRRYVAALREEATRRAVTEERLRIARELHDVVAHGMSVIAVQAGVANYVVDSRPDEVRRALRSIEETSRSGLHELRQLLAVLRSDEDPAALGPAPGLAGIDALVARAREAGVPVCLRVTGEPRPLPAGVDLSAYRIVQEALTNVVKHAGPARSEVLLAYQPDALTIEVTDDGRGDGALGGAGGGGHGIIGMRERAALYRGELLAGPRREGGFKVRARLPVGPARRSRA